MPHIIEIKNINSPALHMFTHLNETQLQHYFEPDPDGIFIAETQTVILRAMDAGYQPLSFLMEERYIGTQGREILDRIPSDGSVPVYVSTLDVLSEITGYHLTRGILGAFRRKHPASVEEICQNARRIAILDNVENPTNVGAIFRCAAALGMDAVLVTPDCADPLQRRAVRVGVGTVFQVPWTYIGQKITPAHARAMADSDAHPDDMSVLDLCRKMDPQDAWPQHGISKLRRLGFYIVAMALRHDTLPIDDPVLAGKEKLAVILGNEGAGLSDETISLCDATVKIPMRHGVDSLNVAAASAVAFWTLA